MGHELLRRILEVVPTGDSNLGAESQLAGHEYVVPTPLVMKQVTVSTCSAYDCEYVDLTDDLKTTLVTCDKEILAQFPDLAASLTDFAAED